jgi:glutamate:GABA antiporter
MTSSTSDTTADDVPIGTTIRLIKSLRRVDIVFFIVAVVISVDAITALGQGGPQGLVWTTILAIVFMIPNAMIFAESAAAFPQEGGPYTWVKRAFGGRWAAVSSILYWVTNPIWLGGSLAFITEQAWSGFVAPIPDGSWGDYLFKFVFIWVAIFVAVVSLRRGKLILNIGAVLKLIVLLVLVVTAVVYIATHGVAQASLGSFAPTAAGFLAVLPIALFAVTGFEAPSAAAGEMHDAQHDTPIAIARGGVITALAYVLPILAIVLMTPPAKLADAGVLPTIRSAFDVFGPAAGPITAVLAIFFVIGLLAQGAGWMVATDRIQAVAAADGGFFNGFFGRFSDRLGTPVRMNILSGVISTIFFVAAMTLVQGTAGAIFQVVLTCAVSTLLISYLIIVPSLISLKMKQPDVPRPYVVPGGTAGFVVLSAVQLLFVILGSIGAVFPGVIEHLFGVSYSFEDNWGVSQLNYELFTIGTLIVVIAVGLIGFEAARRVRRRLAEAGPGIPIFTEVTEEGIAAS